MKRLLLTALLLLTSSAWAAPIDDAAAANVRGDYAAELKITRPLAAKGEAWAESFLGDSYVFGKGVPRDLAEAVKWYRLAAAQGDASAQYSLGRLHDTGLVGVAVQDFTEAAKWYKLAAAQGDPRAQSDLGVMYGNGQGVPQEYVRAHMWFNLGAAKGNAGAVENRNNISKRMTTQQIAVAQKLARDCQARNFKGC